MAYPAAKATLTDQESIQVILQAEAGILDCMAQYFGANNGVVSIIQAETSLTKKVELLNTILPAYSNKENSIAKILQASAKKLAADKNIDPSLIKCPAACK